MFLLDERLTLVSHTADFSVAVDLYHAFLVNYFVTFSASYQHISSEVVLLLLSRFYLYVHVCGFLELMCSLLKKYNHYKVCETF